MGNGKRASFIYYVYFSVEAALQPLHHSLWQYIDDRLESLDTPPLVSVQSSILLFFRCDENSTKRLATFTHLSSRWDARPDCEAIVSTPIGINLLNYIRSPVIRSQPDHRIRSDIIISSSHCLLKIGNFHFDADSWCDLCDACRNYSNGFD